MKSAIDILKEVYTHYKEVVKPDDNWASWETCIEDGTVKLAIDAMEKYAEQFAAPPATVIQPLQWVKATERLPIRPDKKIYLNVLCGYYTTKGSFIQFVGFYAEKHKVPYEDYDGDDGEYDPVEEAHGTLYLKEGWYELEETPGGMYDEVFVSRSVTHWMPLPPLPGESTPTNQLSGVSKKGSWVSAKNSWPNERGSFLIGYKDGRTDSYFIDDVNDLQKEIWFRSAENWLFEWWDKNATKEISKAPPLGIDVESLANELYQALIHMYAQYSGMAVTLGEKTTLSEALKVIEKFKAGYAASKSTSEEEKDLWNELFDDHMKTFCGRREYIEKVISTYKISKR